MIGGQVARNIYNEDLKQKWNNTCAVRMSYILNFSGLKITPAGRKTVSRKDKNWYDYRASYLIDFLKTQ
ncbi:T6SS effector amidase Tae4 family protein [Snodgrassella sp. ESL0323]|uniref:T6SS effector amidase Tae4 family protein n=1 Tax=Snodgrassella sp. ESL0323 TaxID=2705034 RepID=UPI00352F148D